LDEKDWRLLTLLADERNITRTAQKLYLTQPAVTRRISRLEAELGCRLAVRIHSGIELTPEGEDAAEYARGELARLEKLKCSLENSGTAIRGTVRLACANAYARSCLPDILKNFSQRCPRVDLQVVTGSSSLTARRLLSGDAQLAIIRGNFSWNEESLCLRANPYYYAVMTYETDLDRLPELPQIRVTSDAPLQADLDRWWTERYRTPPRVSTIVDRSDIGIEMLRRGLGYSFLSGLYLKSAPRLKRVLLRFADGQPLKRDTCACCRTEVLRIRAVRAFWDFLAETAASK
jgi:DNA-binding transcriptional LysR family regulator